MTEAQPIHGFVYITTPLRGEDLEACAQRTGLPAWHREMNFYMWPDGMVTKEPVRDDQR